MSRAEQLDALTVALDAYCDMRERAKGIAPIAWPMVCMAPFDRLVTAAENLEADRAVAGGKPTEPWPEERIQDARDRLDRALCPTGGSMDFATLEEAVGMVESLLATAYGQHSARVEELRAAWLTAKDGRTSYKAEGRLAGYSEALAMWHPGDAQVEQEAAMRKILATPDPDAQERWERQEAAYRDRRAPTREECIEAERRSMASQSILRKVSDDAK